MAAYLPLKVKHNIIKLMTRNLRLLTGSVELKNAVHPESNPCFDRTFLLEINLQLIGLIAYTAAWTAVDQHDNYVYKSD